MGLMAIIGSALADVEIFDKYFQMILTAYNARKVRNQAQAISTAQKDLDQAQTSDEIKKAADEEAKALRDS